MGMFYLTLTNSRNFIRGKPQAAELNKDGIFEIGPVFPKL